MSNLTTFNFGSQAVRTVTDESGEILFVGKDVAEVLGYTNPNKAMGDHCKGVTKRYPLMTAGGMQNVRVLTEPDVLRLIVNSKMEAAVEFEQWVFEEVLPTVRRTGSYTMQKEPVDHVVLQLQRTEEAVKTFLNLGKLLGTEENMAKVVAIGRARELTGLDVSGLLPHNISVPDKPMTPTEVGKLVGMSAYVVNKTLESAGLQFNNNGVWEPTEEGKKYGTVNPYKSRTSDHTGYRILWHKEVTDVLTSAVAA